MNLFNKYKLYYNYTYTITLLYKLIIMFNRISISLKYNEHC